MKILLIDIETSPNIADVWAMWNVNVGQAQLRESGRMISFAAKWFGNKKMQFFSEFHDGREAMIRAAYELMNEADAIVHYNGNRFDIPMLNRELLVSGFTPPSPAKQIDLYQAVKSRFKFPFNRMDYVAKALGLKGKTKHDGHELWTKCMAGDEKAWKLMKKYNIQDVNILEALYERLLPWIPSHPNRAILASEGACPKCSAAGSLIKEGFALTNTGKFQRYHCSACGAWSRDSKRIKGASKQGVAS